MNSLLATFSVRPNETDTMGLGTWSNHLVGQSYISLFPHSRFKQFRNQKEDGVIVNKKEVPRLLCLYGQGLFTVNYSTPFHFDFRDGDGLRHCYYSVPLNWQNHQETVNSVFSLGTKCFDISNHNLQISFLTKFKAHGTGIPTFVPKPPKSLVGKCSIQRLLNDNVAISKFLSKSLITWGTWEHMRAIVYAAKRKAEKEKAAEKRKAAEEIKAKSSKVKSGRNNCNKRDKNSM